MSTVELVRENDWAVFIVPLIVFTVALELTNRGRADYLVLMGTLIISFILVPTLLDSNSGLPRSTSIPAFFAVILLTIGTADAGLLLSASANAFSAILWGLVVVYRPAP